jgi:hypothetical protein
MGMAKHEMLEHILTRRSDANTPFDTLCSLLTQLGFHERIRGGHHIFTKEGVAEILNPQSRQGKAKAYQVKQVRPVFLKYQLRLGA